MQLSTGSERYNSILFYHLKVMHKVFPCKPVRACSSLSIETIFSWDEFSWSVQLFQNAIQDALCAIHSSYKTLRGPIYADIHSRDVPILYAEIQLLTLLSCRFRRELESKCTIFHLNLVQQIHHTLVFHYGSFLEISPHYHRQLFSPYSSLCLCSRHCRWLHSNTGL